MIAAGLNVQAMLWRTSPSATELEEVALGWLRELIGMPEAFEGVIYDTASVSTLHALAAAREVAVPGVRRGAAWCAPDLGQPRVVLPEHAHSSIDKAVILLGLGLEAIRRVPVDAQLRDARRTRCATRSWRIAPPGGSRSRSWPPSARHRRRASIRSRRSRRCARTRRVAPRGCGVRGRDGDGARSGGTSSTALGGRIRWS